MKSDSTVHFSQYLALLREFNPQVRDLVVYDRELACIWSSDVDQAKSSLVKAQLLQHRDNCACAWPRLLADDLYCEFFDLKNADEKIVLILGLTIASLRGSVPDALAGQQNISLLNQFLVTEYEQCRVLASREDELNHMTDELTKRYEELNLIYKAEDQALNIYHGRELLRQLVINTSRFLSVDVIYLFLPDKNIAYHKFRNDQPVHEHEKLFAFLHTTIYPKLKAENTPIVLNHATDVKNLGLNEVLPFKLIASVVLSGENEVIGSLAIASQNFVTDFTNSDRNLVDVMARKASKIAQSNFDPLTGLENSHSFELIVKELLKQSWTSGLNHAIANVDIDRMAVINDVSGRDAGDQLIKKVGQKLAGMVRSRDVVARIGSDKFGVLLENCDLPTARIVMQKISDEISKIDLEWQGKAHEVSVSIGIAPISTSSDSVTSLLNAAETARNMSKQRGRKSIHVLERDDRDLLSRKQQIQWVGRIQSALREDRLRLYAQLIQPLNAQVNHAHFEILLRLLQEDGSIAVPGQFMPAAECFYLMSSIDFWVIDQAFRQLAEYSSGQSHAACQVSINLSGQSLIDPLNLAEYIRASLAKYGLAGSAICFEITESAAIANIDDARLFIAQARALGCTFSLDDFGTGLSSFAYLKNLQVDYLKIDGSFVRDMVTDPVSASIVSAINQVGHTMNLKTIAEFVENDDIVTRLAGIGVDFVQGYGIGKPVPFTAQLYKKLQTPD